MKGAVNEWGQKVSRHELIRKLFFANQLSGQKSRFYFFDISNLSSSQNDWPVWWFAAAFLMISLHGYLRLKTARLLTKTRTCAPFDESKETIDTILKAEIRSRLWTCYITSDSNVTMKHTSRSNISFLHRVSYYCLGHGVMNAVKMIRSLSMTSSMKPSCPVDFTDITSNN
jgi:heme A synthase